MEMSGWYIAKMSGKVKVSGTWRDSTAPYLKVAGNWKMAKTAWAKIDGAWKSWFTQGGLVDNSFLSNLSAYTGVQNNGIFDSLILSDGSIIIVGSFTTFNGITVNRIAKINSNGQLDSSFASNVGTAFDSDAYSIILQTDNKLVIAGAFTTFNGFTANRIIRLNLDGTVDDTFLQNIGTGFNAAVSQIIVQPDGKIIAVGGDPSITTTSLGFTSFSGTTVNRIARLNVDGTLDIAFYSNTGTGAGTVLRTAALQSDNKILIGGNVISFNGQAVNRIFRLNTDGTLDTSFTNSDPTIINAAPYRIKVLSDNSFISVGNHTGSGRIAKFNSNGVFDSSFGSNITTTGLNAVAQDMEIQPDGKILVVGRFTTFNSVTVGYIIRLESNGQLDTTFMSNIGTGFSDLAFSVNLFSNQKIFVAGEFITFNGTTVNRIINRLNINGTLDLINQISYRGLLGRVDDAALQSDGKIILVGIFSRFGNNEAVNNIIRLNADETLDTTFLSNLGTGPNSEVNVVALQSDGKILIGGRFTTFNGSTQKYITRLNADGTLDNTFTTGGAGLNARVYAITIQPDGSILVGGDFTLVNAISSNRIARLFSNGNPDSTFSSNINSGADSTIRTIALQTDGKIVIGGNFSTFNGITSARIARLNSNGTLDTSFSSNTGSGFSDNVLSLKIKSDGKILAVGQFTSFNSLLCDRIALLNSDGTLDLTPAFYPIGPSLFNDAVTAKKLQSDGKLLVGGFFTSYNGTTVNRLVRINTDGTLDTAFVSNLSGFSGGGVCGIEILPDDSIIVVGTFSNGIRKINPNGTTNTTFESNIGVGITINSGFGPQCVAIQSDNSILVGGIFTSASGSTRNRMARYSSSGVLDSGFNPNFSTSARSGVDSIAVLPSGEIIAIGRFTTVGGLSLNGIVKLSSSGSVDSTFRTNVGTGLNNPTVTIPIPTAKAKVLSDGKILLGGHFTTFNNISANRVIKINTNGTIDTTFFVSGPSGGLASSSIYVNEIVERPNGKIILTGQFANFNQKTNITQVDANGTNDNSFLVNYTSGGYISDVTLLPNGKIIVSGDFVRFGYRRQNRITALNENGTPDTSSPFTVTPGGTATLINYCAFDPNGKILIVGPHSYFNETVSIGLTRLNADGSVDEAFAANAGAGTTLGNSLTILNNERILLCGSFTGFNNISFSSIAKISIEAAG